jgi:transcription elongation factor Elf1
MPTLQPPQTFHCSNCGWKKTIAHAIGDVRIPGLNHIDRCGNCGSNSLEGKPASPLEITLTKLGGLLGRR